MGELGRRDVTHYGERSCATGKKRVKAGVGGRLESGFVTSSVFNA